MNIPTFVPCVLGLMLSACGAFQAAHVINVQVNPQLTVSTQIQLHQGSSPEPDILDFNDPRLARVMQSLVSQVGHAVNFDFDVGMLPRPRKQFFESLLDHSLGYLPTDATHMIMRFPEAFAYGAARLHSIRFDYRGTERESDLDFDAVTGALTITMGSGEYPVPSNSLSFVFEHEYDKYLTTLFANGAGIANLATDTELQHAYFRYLERLHPGIREQTPRTLEEVEQWKAPDRIVALVDLYEKVSLDAKLRKDIENELVDTSTFRAIHDPSPQIANELSPDSRFVKARRAYAQWARSHAKELTDSAFKNLLSVAVVPVSGPSGYHYEVLPDMNLRVLWNVAFDRWVGDPNSPIASVICAGELGSERSFRSSCSEDPPWYRVTFARDDLRAMLFEDLATRHNPALSEAVLANAPAYSSALALWRASESDDTVWQAITQRITGNYALSNTIELRDELARLWRQFPNRHADILAGLVWIDRPEISNDRPRVEWDAFAQTFGSAPTTADFVRMLETAAYTAPYAWLALEAMDPNAHALERYLPFITHMLDTREQHLSFDPLSRTMRVVLARRNRGEMAQARAFIDQRAQAHPSEESSLRSLRDMEPPPRSRARTHSHDPEDERVINPM